MKVHKDGGWLAFVPVAPGNFRFELRAAKNKDVDSTAINVHLPELPHYSYDSLYILSSTTEPLPMMGVREGDLIDIGFSGTPYCNAFCVVLPGGDTIPMQEELARGYYNQKSVFNQESIISSGSTPESLTIRGNYQGNFYVPHCLSDSLRLVYHIYPPSNEQIEWYDKHASEDRSCTGGKTKEVKGHQGRNCSDCDL